jgi:hypothetical protein
MQSRPPSIVLLVAAGAAAAALAFVGAALWFALTHQSSIDITPDRTAIESAFQTTS